MSADANAPARYRVRLFDGDGELALEAEVAASDPHEAIGRACSANQPDAPRRGRVSVERLG